MGKKKSSSKKKNRSSGSKAAVPVVVEPLSRGWNASEPLPTTPAPAALSRHPTHPIGCRVMVHGLEKAPQHNGIEGFIVDCFEDTGRNGVRLSNGKELKISPANLKIIKLPKSYDPIEQDSDGQSGLHLAVQDIVDSGAGATAPNEFLQMLLDSERLSESIQVCQQMHNDHGLAPIHIAASAGDVGLCEILLRAGAPVNLQTLQASKNSSSEKKCDDKTPAHLAFDMLRQQFKAATDQVQELVLDTNLLTMLLQHGATVNKPDAAGQAPLHIAILGKMNEATRWLLEAKADPNLGCKAFMKDNSAIHHAVMSHDLRLLKLLVDYNADVNSTGTNSWTPLGLTGRMGALDSAQALLQVTRPTYR